MDPLESDIKEILTELIISFEGSLEILAAALAREGDAEKLYAALIQQIAIAENSNVTSPLTMRLATSALAAVGAVHLENQTHHHSPQEKH